MTLSVCSLFFPANRRLTKRKVAVSGNPALTSGILASENEKEAGP